MVGDREGINMTIENIFIEEKGRYVHINRDTFKNLSIDQQVNFFNTICMMREEIYKVDILWMGTEIINWLRAEIEELHTK